MTILIAFLCFCHTTPVAFGAVWFSVVRRLYKTVWSLLSRSRSTLLKQLPRRGTRWLSLPKLETWTANRICRYSARALRWKFGADKLSCRSATKFFVKSKFVTPTAERRMKEASLKEHTMQLIYSLPFNVTKDTRLAIFQYKIIHHILPTNSTLFRDSIKEHDKCHLCGERQTLTHLFVTCSEARLVWSLFTNWWGSKNRGRITLDKNEIIYGIIEYVYGIYHIWQIWNNI